MTNDTSVRDTESGVLPGVRSIRSRFKASPKAGMRLEDRDRKLLCHLFLNRAMSRAQLQELHFGSVPRCNSRLRQLFDHGFLTRFYPPVAPYGAQAIYSIGRAAVPVVAQDLEMDLAEVSRLSRRNATPTFIEHTLAIVDVWLAFRKAVMGRSDVEIEQWLPELLCRHEYEIRGDSRGWRKEVFKPDAFVRLRDIRTEAHHSFFIEVDLGHTSSHQFLGKVAMHQRYLESGLFEKIFGAGIFKTLVLTTGRKRLSNLVGLLEAQKSDLFWFACFDILTPPRVLESAWHVPMRPENSALLP